MKIESHAGNRWFVELILNENDQQTYDVVSRVKSKLNCLEILIIDARLRNIRKRIAEKAQDMLDKLERIKQS